MAGTVIGRQWFVLRTLEKGHSRAGEIPKMHGEFPKKYFIFSWQVNFIIEFVKWYFESKLSPIKIDIWLELEINDIISYDSDHLCL